MTTVPDPQAGHSEAGPGRDYDGPELHSCTPEYAAEYAGYLAWAASGPAAGEIEPEAEL